MDNNRYCYRYPRPAVTADCVVFRHSDQGLQVLLIERGGEPYKGCWAFPGGFMNMDETIDQCAHRELEEETGLKQVELEQLHAYSAPDRDPRERVMTVAFVGLLRQKGCEVVAGDDAAKARWFPVDALPSLAFDHDQILSDALQRLKAFGNHAE